MQKNLFEILIICLVSLLLISCGENKLSDKQREVAWMERGKTATKAKLKDPSSVKFNNVFFHKGVDGIPMTCGEVNSKNSYGGYGGFQKFISAGKPELTYLQEQVSDFNNLWIKFCQ